MKITCSRKKFKKSINITERIVGKNNTLPILNNILIEARKGALKVSSTNLEIGINCLIPSKVDDDGEITIPIKVLSGFINNITDEKVSMESKGLLLNIKSSKCRASLNGQDAKDFPIIPKITGDVLFDIEGSVLKYGLSQVVLSASTSGNRPEINGVLFKISKGTMIIVATDGFRLAEKSIKLKKAIDQSVDFIVPLRGVQEFVRILGDNSGFIKSVLGKNQILFSINSGGTDDLNVDIVSRLIDGNFPDYKQLIPNKFKTEVVVNKDDLLNAVKVGSVFSGKVNDIKLIASNGKQDVSIVSRDIESGENISKIKSSISGDDMEITFNYRYVLDGLIGIDGDEVFIGLNGVNQPALFRSVNNKDFLYIVMPIRNR